MTRLTCNTLQKILAIISIGLFILAPLYVLHRSNYTKTILFTNITNQNIKETTRNSIDFTDGNIINASLTTAIVESGVAMLSHYPAPDDDISKSDELLLSWLKDPVHTYKFYPNAMAYDSERHVMVLSLQGVKYLYTIDLADGSKKDDIPTADDNHTGVACEGNFYYYSIGDGYSSSQDLYRYNKAAFYNPTSGVGEGTSSKDGYPLTIMDNHTCSV